MESPQVKKASVSKWSTTGVLHPTACCRPVERADGDCSLAHTGQVRMQVNSRMIKTQEVVRSLASEIGWLLALEHVWLIMGRVILLMMMVYDVRRESLPCTLTSPSDVPTRGRGVT